MEQNQKQQQQNQEQPFKCSGDCLNCRLNNVERRTQWLYCASQFTYNSMRMIEAMHVSLNAMQGDLNELKVKIESIQNNEANVLEPSLSVVTDAMVKKKDQETTQEGDGA